LRFIILAIVGTVLLATPVLADEQYKASIAAATGSPVTLNALANAIKAYISHEIDGAVGTAEI
jgi:hypothetical protein